MNLSQDLLLHAMELALVRAEPSSIVMRRAVSASYYALFHGLNADAAALIAPNVSADVNYRVQRWFDHAEMKKICGRFLKETLDQPLLGLIGSSASKELQLVCRSFIQLQEARHDADYDLKERLTRERTAQLVETAATAMDIWGDIKHSAEANIFILSLLLWKNWEDKERR